MDVCPILTSRHRDDLGGEHHHASGQLSDRLPRLIDCSLDDTLCRDTLDVRAVSAVRAAAADHVNVVCIDGASKLVYAGAMSTARRPAVGVHVVHERVSLLQHNDVVGAQHGPTETERPGQARERRTLAGDRVEALDVVDGVSLVPRAAEHEDVAAVTDSSGRHDGLP